MARKIIHMDLDAFYCAVEELLDPGLSGKAFAVGGSPDGRGVVASCSYAARNYGVRSAMPMARARQLCPQLIIQRWTKGEYGKRSRSVMGILNRFSDRLEQLSIDEAFLDVSNNSEPVEKIARDIQSTIKQETQLPCSLGVSTNKLVSKIATDVGKSAVKTNTYPHAVQVVPVGREAEFLAPLPARMLWGVGPKTYETLETLGLYTIGAIAAWPETDFIQRFGQMGSDLVRRAKGIDNSPVINSRETKSISHENTFGTDIDDEQYLINVMKVHCESIVKSLHKENLRGSTIKIKLRWPHFETITRQTTLEKPTDDFDTIFNTAVALFKDNWKKGFPVRLIGVGISGFTLPDQQLSLWDAGQHIRQDQLQTAINTLQQKFGPDVIKLGKNLHR
jgi:DNA polymerase-4